MTLRQLWCAMRGHAGVRVRYHDGHPHLTCKRCGREWRDKR